MSEKVIIRNKTGASSAGFVSGRRGHRPLQGPWEGSAIILYKVFIEGGGFCYGGDV